MKEENVLVGILVANSIVGQQSRFARLPVPEERQRELDQARVPIEKWCSRQTPPGYFQGAGFLGSLLLPAVYTKNDACPQSMFTPERKLDYVFASGVMLQLLNMLGCFILCWYAVGMFVSLLRGRPGFLLTFSRRDVLRIAVWGVLVPVALFFVLMELTPLGGRSYGLNGHNPGALLRLVAEVLVFLLLLPLPFQILWRRACRERGRELGFRKLPAAVWHCNMFVGWVVLLVSFTALIRPGLAFAERYWSDRERFFIHAEFSSWTDEQLARKFRSEVLDVLPK